MDKKEIATRIGYFRTKENLSARELSRRIGNSDLYISRFEGEQFNMPLDKLLEILEVCNVSPAEFFADNYSSYKEDMELYKDFCNLSKEEKDVIRMVISKFKK